MELDPAVVNDVERLGDLAAHEIDTQAWDNVSDPYTPEARAALAAMTARLIEGGVNRTVAEWTVTFWIGGRRLGHSIARCHADTLRMAEDGLIRPVG